jgi:hypothetical protein
MQSDHPTSEVSRSALLSSMGALWSLLFYTPGTAGVVKGQGRDTRPGRGEQPSAGMSPIGASQG